MQTKTCTQCRGVKPIDQFFRTGFHPSGKEKRRGNCKDCAKKDTAEWRKKNRAHYNKYMGEWRGKNPDKVRLMEIKRDYGLSAEEYLKMIESQNNKCKICSSGPKGKRPLVIDHCHKTGKIRGLLCYRCNRAIVILDDKEHMEKAIAYLSQ